MKTLILILVLIVIETETWGQSFKQPQSIIFKSAAERSILTQDLYNLTEESNNIEIDCHSIILNDTIWFSLSTNFNKECFFLIENSINGKNYKPVQLIKCYGRANQTIRYGCQPQLANNTEYIWYKVTQIINGEMIIVGDEIIANTNRNICKPRGVIQF